MANESKIARSHLFTVRLWLEETGPGRFEWRGRVEHVLSGERQYFCNWPALLAPFEEFLTPRQDGSRKAGPEQGK